MVLAICEAYICTKLEGDWLESDPKHRRIWGKCLEFSMFHHSLCKQITSFFMFIFLFCSDRSLGLLSIAVSGFKTAPGEKGAKIPMEKLPKACEKEYMRMAMLKHEETFKQQVHELHRLYRTQKTLMKNVEKSSQSGWNNPESLDKRNEICFRQIYEPDAKNYYRSSTHTTKLDHLDQPVEDETEANNGALQIINENELQLTLGPSSYNTSDSGVTHSSSSTGSSHERNRSDTKRVKGQEMEVLGLTESSSVYQNGSIRGEKKMLDYPHWPFQVVSLNMT